MKTSHWALRPGEELQWGRDQLIAEMIQLYLLRRRTVGLQWGRDQLIAEMHLRDLLIATPPRFNGAAIS